MTAQLQHRLERALAQVGSAVPSVAEKGRQRVLFVLRSTQQQNRTSERQERRAARRSMEARYKVLCAHPAAGDNLPTVVELVTDPSIRIELAVKILDLLIKPASPDLPQ